MTKKAKSSQLVIFSLFVIVLLFLLAGCSGGGNNGVVPNSGESVFIDNDSLPLDQSTINADTRNAQWGNVYFHRIMTRAIIRYYLNNYASDTQLYQLLTDGDTNLSDWTFSVYGEQMVEGSYDEDEPLLALRYLNHFMSPKTQPATINPVGFQFIGYGSSATALNWALAIGKSNSYTYQSSVNNLKSATTVDKKKSACRTFGRILHLLQDTSSPAHVRDDSHVTWDPDEWEDWGEKSGTERTSLQNEIYRIVNTAMTGPMVRDTTGYPSNALIDRFYDNPDRSYILSNVNCTGVQAIFKYLSVSTNQLTFSGDRKYYSDSRLNCKTFPQAKSVIRNGSNIWFKGAPGTDVSIGLRDAGIIIDYVNFQYLIGKGNSQLTTWITNFRNTNGREPSDLELMSAITSNPKYFDILDSNDSDHFLGTVDGPFEDQFRYVLQMAVKSGAALLHEYYLGVWGG